MNQRYNGANARQVRDQQELERIQQELNLKELKYILSLPEGRRLIWRYLSTCGVFQSSFDTNGSRVFFNEGMRNVGLKIYSEVAAADPEAFLLMTKEQRKDEAANDRRAAKRGADTNTDRD